MILGTIVMLAIFGVIKTRTGYVKSNQRYWKNYFEKNNEIRPILKDGFLY